MRNDTKGRPRHVSDNGYEIGGSNDKERSDELIVNLQVRTQIVNTLHVQIYYKGLGSEEGKGKDDEGFIEFVVNDATGDDTRRGMATRLLTAATTKRDPLRNARQQWRYCHHRHAGK